MNPELNRLSDLLRASVDAGEYAGASVMVLHKGEEIYYTDYGYADVESGKKIARDTIFRIYSQSKPVTGTAAVMNIDRGVLSPRAMVARFLPGFANQRYDTEHSQGLAVVSDRPMFVSDLLNMTSGLLYPDCSPDVALVVREMEDLRKRGVQLSTVEFANRLGGCRLAFKPGDRWAYGYSADVMGAVIEIAAGKRFGQYLQDEIFGPLGMKDTGFVVPEAKRARLATAYDHRDHTRKRFDYADWHLGLNAYREDTAFESGGAGLVSTIGDYAEFVKMLMNRGTYNGHRFLSAAGFDYLISPQLTPWQARTFNWQDLGGQNYGNFLFMKTFGGCSSTTDAIGSFGWGGWLETNFTLDLKNELAVLFMAQNQSPQDNSHLFHRLRNAAYYALT